MTSDPLHNPGVTPSQPVPGFGQPQIGPGDQGAQQRPFELPSSGPAPLEQTPAAAGSSPSPMAMMASSAASVNKISPDQLTQSVTHLQGQFSHIQNSLQDSSVTDKFSPEHLGAMQQLVGQMNPHMNAIANETGGTFQPPEIKSDGVLKSIVQWVNGSQKTFGGALSYLSSADGKQMNVASMMRLQYSVQQASQRGELFASVISSTVSGIKTIMSTQLG